jgi:hypothetical protein
VLVRRSFTCGTTAPEESFTVPATLPTGEAAAGNALRNISAVIPKRESTMRLDMVIP